MNPPSADQSPVSFRAHVLHLPQKGLPVKIAADERQRAALAAAHDLVAVTRYRADILVTKWNRNGVKVAGTVEADIVQECIVTLDLLDNHISESFETVFLPEDSKLGRLGFHDGGEIVLDPEGPDSPDTFAGDSIDVGALAEEFFALAIDPYPRKPGATLTDPATEESDDDAGSLRAQLAGLRQKT